MRDRLILWVALGAGLGRLPKAPGTFGSLLGLVWLWGVFQIDSLGVLAAVLVASLMVGVWVCTEAERVLGQHDPGCIVLDEILALPIAGLGWLLWSRLYGGEDGVVPSLLWLAAIFAVFRVFDIAKPWPVGVSQQLPRGWGVMADDVLAAILTALLLFAGRWLLSIF